MTGRHKALRAEPATDVSATHAGQQAPEKRQEPLTAVDHSAQAETIASLENDLLAFKTRDKKGKEVPLFTVKQVAIMLKAILLNHHSLTGNVKNLAPLLQRIGGWASSTAENALGYEVTQEECNELAAYFVELAPAIGRIIREYPEKFQEVKDEKLKNNLKR